MGNHQEEKIATGEGHQVLISKSAIGNFALNALTHPNARIRIDNFQYARRLKDFDIVILPFSEFAIPDAHHSSPSKDPYKDIFDKQTLEALDTGTMFCFTHHKENTPGNFADYHTSGYFSDNAVAECFNTQAGFQWIHSRKIRIGRNSTPILKSDVKRTEFGTFLSKWGATYNYFNTFGNGHFDDILCTIGNYVSGFSIDHSRGSFVYLPFQPNHSSASEMLGAAACLVDSLLTYKAKRLRELPDWAKEPLFEIEKKFATDKAHLLDSLRSLDDKIAPYEEAKLLLIASEHNLETATPTFVRTRPGIPTERNEKFLEDFWMLNGKREKAVICEVKSITKGFKKSAIFDVYNHREKNDLPETFPAVVFANCNLQAGSWTKKAVPIQKGDYQIAAAHHVLITRIEDLVQLWNLLISQTITVDAIVKYFTTEVGWLQCDNGKITIHK